VNAFAHGNLATAWLRLAEAEAALHALIEVPPSKYSDVEAVLRRLQGARWAVAEAQRLIHDAQAIDEMESANTLPAAPDSNTRRIG
jgi:hypothetical protein